MTILYSDIMTSYGIISAFPTREGGFSDGIYASLNLTSFTGDRYETVDKNIKKYLEALGATPEKTVRTHQVHGKQIRRVGKENSGEGVLAGAQAVDCDGLYTECRELSLMVSSADCPTVLIYAPDKDMIGAVHSGWRGTALDIGGELIRIMEMEGCRAESMTAFLPPAIGSCCFETDPDVPYAMLEKYGQLPEDCVCKIATARYKVDLQRIIARSLVLHGLNEQRIVLCPVCSCCHEEYYSHRRSGLRRGLSAAVIRNPQ